MLSLTEATYTPPTVRNTILGLGCYCLDHRFFGWLYIVVRPVSSNGQGLHFHLSHFSTLTFYSPRCSAIMKDPKVIGDLGIYDFATFFDFL